MIEKIPTMPINLSSGLVNKINEIIDVVEEYRLTVDRLEEELRQLHIRADSEDEELAKTVPQ